MTTTPDQPRAVAYRVDYHHWNIARREQGDEWETICTTSEDWEPITAAEVESWTPLVPAVSVSPEDTGLRERVAEAMYRAWQGSSPLSFAEQADDVRDEYLRAADETVPVFEQAHGDLTAENARLRSDLDHLTKAYAATLAEASRSTPAPGADLVVSVSQWLLDNCSDINGDRMHYHATRPMARELLALIDAHSTPALPDGAAAILRAYLSGWLPAHFDKPEGWYDVAALKLAESLVADVLPELLSAPATDPASDTDPASLSWAVRHVPPGTTDREDVDTEIRSGWWVLGVDPEDPEHPVVQVWLGETLPVATDPEPATPDGPEETKRPSEAVVHNAVAGALIGVYGFVRLDVRYEAAEAARRVVERWLSFGKPVAPQAPAEPTATPSDLQVAPELGATSAGPAVPEDTATRPWREGQPPARLLSDTTRPAGEES